MKRNSSVILALSAMFMLASCGGSQPASSSHPTGISTPATSSHPTGLSTPAAESSTQPTGLSVPAEVSSEQPAASSQQEASSAVDLSGQVDPLASSPMKVSKKKGEIIIESGVEVNPSKATEYQWLNVNLTGSTANVELLFTFTPEAGDPVAYDASKVKTDCAALIEETSNGFFKVKEEGKYNFYIETGDYQPGIWVEKVKETPEVDPGTVVTANLYVKFNISDADIDRVYAWVWTSETDGAWYYATHVAETWTAASNRHYTISIADPVGKKVKVASFSAESGVDAEHAPDAQWSGKIAESAEATFQTWGADANAA